MLRSVREMRMLGIEKEIVDSLTALSVNLLQGIPKLEESIK